MPEFVLGCLSLEQDYVPLQGQLLLEEVFADVESAEPGHLLLVLVLVAKVRLLDLLLAARVLLPAVLKVAVMVETIDPPCIARAARI